MLVPAPRADDAPPIDDWEREAVLTELARMALGIRLDGVAGIERPERLTQQQIDQIVEACTMLEDDLDQPGAAA